MTDIATAAVEGVVTDVSERVKTIAYTHDDITYVIRKDALDDLEILEFVEDQKFITVMRRVLGEEQWGRYKEAHRAEDGRVSTDGFEGFINGLFGKLNAGKA